MRNLLMLAVFVVVWGTVGTIVAFYAGRLFRINIQSDENRTRQLMRRGAKWDIGGLK